MVGAVPGVRHYVDMRKIPLTGLPLRIGRELGLIEPAPGEARGKYARVISVRDDSTRRQAAIGSAWAAFLVLIFVSAALSSHTPTWERLLDACLVPVFARNFVRTVRQWRRTTRATGVSAEAP